MYRNPFTPIFGGKPSSFFGRQDILNRFDAALIDQGSDYRALFLTGTRGSGKTVLLEQLSQRAVRKGWRVIDLGPEGTADALVRRLVRHSEATSTISPQMSVSVLGSGVSASGVSKSKTITYPAQDLSIILQEAVEKELKGVLVTIDEVQKVTQQDMSAVCDAFQMASRKGHSVMIAVAGLPYAHDEIIHYRGCTYMRRAAHEEIGLFGRMEVREAFVGAMTRTEGLSLDDAALDRLVAASMGQPYLVQLLGYYVVGQAIDEGHVGTYEIGEKEMRPMIPLAVQTYKERALAPLLSELSPLETNYLESMSHVLDERHVARTADVARQLGREQQQLSRARDNLLRNGLIIAPQRGVVRFNVPYLRDYVQEAGNVLSKTARLAEEWDV